MLPGKDLYDGLRIISSDDDTLVMRSCVVKVKDLVLYLDHANQVRGLPVEEVVINHVGEFPKVLSPVKVQYVKRHSSLDRPEEPLAAADLDVSHTGEEESDDSDFVDSDNDIEDGDDDL